MNPYGEIFDEVFKACLKVTEDVYDYVEPKGELGDRPFPHIFIGESMTVDDIYKDKINGNTSQTIHFWATLEQRRTLYSLMGRTQSEVRKMARTNNFKLSVRDMNPQVLTDNSTSVPLLHGILEVDVYFS